MSPPSDHDPDPADMDDSILVPSSEGSGELVAVPFHVWAEHFVAEMEALEAKLEVERRRWHPLRLFGLDVGY